MRWCTLLRVCCVPSSTRQPLLRISLFYYLNYFPPSSSFNCSIIPKLLRSRGKKGQSDEITKSSSAKLYRRQDGINSEKQWKYHHIVNHLCYCVAASVSLPLSLSCSRWFSRLKSIFCCVLFVSVCRHCRHDTNARVHRRTEFPFNLTPCKLLLAALVFQMCIFVYCVWVENSERKNKTAARTHRLYP